MSDTVIKVESLGKKYRIRRGTERESYNTLRDAFPKALYSLLHPVKSVREASEDFWALKDVSFEVKRGECLGIIGRNGAGKSTLLRILSRITDPTAGRVELHGRVGSLLEVGTGFHNELTGRENIYLNGTILGMKKKEIDRKFDEIVAFSEIEKFLDTPVKHYSSGMYVRLAFAVAAHLDPEILVVDEVLAVGDLQFQEKCIGKMQDIAGKRGRTVLFVSHNMLAIRSLCSRVILLEKGKVSMDGNTASVVNGYKELMRFRKIDATTDIADLKSRRGGGAVRFTSIEVTDDKGNPTFNFRMGETIHFRIFYETFRSIEGITLYICLKGGMTREVVTSFEYVLTDDSIPPGVKGGAAVVVPAVSLRPGEYPLYFWLGDKWKKEASCDALDEATLPIVISPAGFGINEETDAHPILDGYVSLPSYLASNHRDDQASIKKGY
jgi:lipopolysaccharide transport system ATP-binding protein